MHSPKKFLPKKYKLALFAIFCFLTAAGVAAQESVPAKSAAQNPSPMAETTRRHERLVDKNFSGVSFSLAGILPKTVEVFVPCKSTRAREVDLLLHFHGAAFVVRHAASQYHGKIVAATINLGSGSGVYGRAFDDSTTFAILVAAILDSAQHALGHGLHARKIILSGFSAGYGAVRKIISQPQNYARTTSILLLDGIHASYIPDGKALADGGEINPADVAPFLRFAEDAVRPKSHKKFLISHSEIFPGTFVSTTEATDYLLGKLDMRRKPVLRWGPMGMQQLSSARRQHFAIIGFAGNTAPDHVDHFHSLSFFLRRLNAL